MAHLTSKKRLKVVTIGGGTGHFTLLSGLKEYPVHISAIVSMADDGGSTGVLRDEMGVLPPGDVRLCLTALAEDTSTLRALFAYRFSDGPARGHVFGSLFLSALQKTTGSFVRAVEEASHVLAIRGRVIPVSEGNMRLSVHLKDGSTIMGEHALDSDKRIKSIGVASIGLVDTVAPTADALKSIEEADVIIIGPGDLFGSVMPPLLVPGVAFAVSQSKAHVFYVANLTNKKGQTEGFSVHDYADVINRTLGGDRIDVVVSNTGVPEAELVARYEEREGSGMVAPADPHGRPYEILAYDVLARDTVSFQATDTIAHTRSFIRHDSKKLAAAIMDVVSRL